jgi:L-threonylcarbamoyladenylate synthase
MGDGMSNIVEPTTENIKKAVKSMRNGGVVVCPSDCNLGLAVDPWNESAVKKTFEIKQRPATKPLTLFITEPKDWKVYAEFNKETEEIVDKIADAFWPGPLNVILKKNERVPSAMVCGGETVSISCMGNPILNELIQEFNQPIAMTSANMAGQADGVLVDINMASQQVGDKVDFILKGEAQGTTKSSTIIDLTGSPKVVRLGDITVDQLNKVLNNFATVE